MDRRKGLEAWVRDGWRAGLDRWIGRIDWMDSTYKCGDGWMDRSKEKWMEGQWMDKWI